MVTVLINITELNQLQDQEKIDALANVTDGIAHHVNTLLTIITNSANLIKRMHADKCETVELAEMMLEESVAGKALTDALRHCARSATTTWELAAIDPGATISATVSHLRGEFSKENIQVSVHATHRSKIKFDPRLLDRIVRNLCQNAAEAMPDGGSINIHIENIALLKKSVTVNGRLLDPGKYIKISVEDNGHGIPQELQDKIFQPFFSTGMGSRHGMGLAETLGLVEAARGGIRLDSSAEGTRIKIFLPAIQTDSYPPS
jgi:signal transduction histidine kinase